jgi:hypothetical protein
MGQADKVIEQGSQEIVIPVYPVHAEVGDDLTLRLIDPIPNAPLEPQKPNTGRPKKMAKERDLSDVSGVKTIREDSASEQGAIGSHGENAPAQTKVPQSDADKREDKANG